MNEYCFVVDEECKGNRLDRFIVTKNETLSRSRIQNLILEGNVTVNGEKIPKNSLVNLGDIVVINVPEPVNSDVKAQDLPLNIVYQDDDLLVVNKDKGMVVHPAAGNYDCTLVNALMFHCKDKLSSINGIVRPGIVHRIDKNTSGLLVVAKNDISHISLASQIKAHSFTREYETVVCGKFKEASGTIDAPIGRNQLDRKKMCVTSVGYNHSRNAVTHYQVLTEMDGYTHVKVQLETGRTHQIRVHMAYIGHPVLGDDVYGRAYKNLFGQCLHAKKIGFIHPKTNEYMEFDSELPKYFKDILVWLSQ